MADEALPLVDHVRNNSVLVSLIVIGAHGFDGLEFHLERVARSLAKGYAFHEVLLVDTADGSAHRELAERLGAVSPQVRILQVEGAADFDRLTTLGYKECIGDLVILTSADEIEFLDLEPLLERLLAGQPLVRLRRAVGTAVERMSSLLVGSLTGLKVDTRFCRTIALNRQLLSELLVDPNEIHLFRFTAQTRFAAQSVIETTQPQTRRGLPLFLRRIDLVARLVATSAPRLLRVASALCITLALAALMSLVYVAGVWLVRAEIAEGWTTTVSLLAIWMSVQLGATAILCLALSRLLDGNDRARMPRLVDETTISDLFASSGLLNVERANDAPRRDEPAHS